MEKDLVGYRFHPTGEELINYYLKNKILGKSRLVEDAISEINICDHDPIVLPSLSKLESKDPVWYFFSRIVYTTSKKTATKRTTPSGFWKSTGKDRKIKDKRGNGVEIGSKKTLVYHSGKVPNGVWTPWVMHEYHITDLPLPQRTYVICQVMYKGEDADLTEPSNSLVSDPNSSRAINTAPEVEHPVQGTSDGMFLYDLVNPMTDHWELSVGDGFSPNTFLGEINSNNNLNVQPQTTSDDEFWRQVLNGGDLEEASAYPEIRMITNHNDHEPKKPLSGTIDDYSSSDNDSDAETISGISYQGTSSPGDSIGTSNRHFPSSSSTDSCTDLQTSPINRKNKESQVTRRTIPSTQEVFQMKEGKWKETVDASMDKKLPSMVKTEKKGWFITEETMERNRKNPPYIYLMNMIIGFILLLALISDIISVLVSVKT